MNVGFNIPTKVDTEPAERTFDLRQYLNFVWRHWLFIVSVTALSFLAAEIYLVGATPLYTATTQVLLERAEKAPIDTSSTDFYRLNDFSYIENQLAILRSNSLLRRVVIKERLAAPPQSTGVPKEDPTAEEQSILDGINRLRGVLAVSRSGNAQVLNISITWEDPTRAAQLANAVANAYVVNQLDARFESAKQASGWLSDRLVELRQQLRDSEEAVTKFRNEHGLVRSGPTIALNDQQLAELNSKLIAARADVAEKKTRVDFLDDVAQGKKTLASMPDSFQSSAQSGAMAALRGKLADVSQRQADLGEDRELLLLAGPVKQHVRDRREHEPRCRQRQEQNRRPDEVVHDAPVRHRPQQQRQQRDDDHRQPVADIHRPQKISGFPFELQLTHRTALVHLGKEERDHEH